MNWIFEHIQVIILVGGAIAYWLNQRRKANEEAEAEQRGLMTPPEMPQTHAPADDEAERVRRIQEEIRRKILERMGGGAPKPPPSPMSEVEPEDAFEDEPMPSRPAARAEAHAQTSAREQAATLDQAILARQQQLAEQMRELSAMRGLAPDKVATDAEAAEAQSPTSETAARGSLLAELRNPASVRRAIVLREVLGTPVGLR